MNPVPRLNVLVFLRTLVACWLFGLSATAAQAQQELRIGVIYPLTGPAASTGAELRSALELAADIVNNGAKTVPGLPFSAGGGIA